jgi:carbonic anhydrase
MCRSSLNFKNPEKALQEILDGNQRYVAGKLTHPRQTAQRRRELVPHQEPFATVLGCSDSRVPPEVIFDQGLGDLFVLRVAGNILDDEAVLGSLE